MCKEIYAKYNKTFISSASYGFYKELKSQANILSIIDRSEFAKETVTSSKMAAVKVLKRIATSTHGKLYEDTSFVRLSE